MNSVGNGNVTFTPSMAVEEQTDVQSSFSRCWGSIK